MKQQMTCKVVVKVVDHRSKEPNDQWRRRLFSKEQTIRVLKEWWKIYVRVASRPAEKLSSKFELVDS